MVLFARGKTIESVRSSHRIFSQEKDIPPFSIPIGKDSIAALNVIGLRRAGFGPAFRKEMKNGIWFLGFYSSFASSETKPGKFFEDCFLVASG